MTSIILTRLRCYRMTNPGKPALICGAIRMAIVSVLKAGTACAPRWLCDISVLQI